MRVAVGGE
jgi:hypothetical protein